MKRRTHLIGRIVLACLMTALASQPFTAKAQSSPQFPELISYAELLELSPERRAEYLDGVRQLLVELSETTGQGPGSLFGYEPFELESAPSTRYGLWLLKSMIREAQAQVSKAAPSAKDLCQKQNGVYLTYSDSGETKTYCALRPVGPGGLQRGCETLKFKNNMILCATDEMKKIDALDRQLKAQGQAPVNAETKDFGPKPGASETGYKPVAETKPEEKIEKKDEPAAPSFASKDGATKQMILPKEANDSCFDVSGIVCKAPKNKKEAQAQLTDYRKRLATLKEGNQCLYSGNISYYAGKPGGASVELPSADQLEKEVFAAGNCKPVTQVTIGGQSYGCNPAKQVLCNPLVFGTGSSGKGLCVSRIKAATKECDRAASSNKNTFIASSAPGLQEEWERFRKGFTKMCGDAKNRQPFCKECQLIAKRIGQMEMKRTNGKCTSPSRYDSDSAPGSLPDAFQGRSVQ